MSNMRGESGRSVAPSIPEGFQPIAGGQRSATTGQDYEWISIPIGIAAIRRHTGFPELS